MTFANTYASFLSSASAFFWKCSAASLDMRIITGLVSLDAIRKEFFTNVSKYISRIICKFCNLCLHSSYNYGTSPTRPGERSVLPTTLFTTLIDSSSSGRGGFQLRVFLFTTMGTKIQNAQWKQAGIREAITHLNLIREEALWNQTDWTPTIPQVVKELEKYCESIGYKPVVNQPTLNKGGDKD
jgi:hypothetical protein